MTNEQKQLLLKDLCARLPYGVKITFRHNGFRWDWPQTLDEIKKCEDGEYAINGWGLRGIKPYLRPMSSMSEEERTWYKSLLIGKEALKYPNKELNVTEWSEEEKRILKGIKGKIDHDQTYGVSKLEMLSFLEKLRPYWKPSEEQMSVLVER